jgi:hypothetical protein
MSAIDTTRRRALRGASLAGLFGMSATATASPGAPQDAKLITVCDRMIVNETEIYLLPEYDEFAPDFGPNHAHFEQLMDERDRLIELIDECQNPISAAGCIAIARVALSWADRDPQGKIMCDDFGEEMMIKLVESVAAGFIWPPRPGSCSTAHWAPQMTPDEVVKHQAAAEAADEARAQAYRETKARERAARRAEWALGRCRPGGRSYSVWTWTGACMSGTLETSSRLPALMTPASTSPVAIILFGGRGTPS